jgi:uncharacterized membrane protein
MGVEIIVPVAVFATVFGIVWIAVSAKNKERLALIEKGLDASIFKEAGRTHWRYGALKFGLLAIGVGIGLVIGNILEVNGIMDDEVAYFAMIFIFGGLGLLSYYKLMGKIKPEKED